MKRGDVFDAQLNPSKASEQGGLRPVIVVSRDAINDTSPVIVILPVTSAANIKKHYPNNVLLAAGEGGLTVDSIALGGQIRAISTTRLLRQRGTLSSAAMRHIERALRITLDL